MSNHQRLRKGQAHVEYLAVRSAIDELSGAGYDLKTIYKKLKAEGRITMSYQALHENRNRGKKKELLAATKIIAHEAAIVALKEKAADSPEAAALLKALTRKDLPTIKREVEASPQKEQRRQRLAATIDEKIKENSRLFSQGSAPDYAESEFEREKARLV